MLFIWYGIFAPPHPDVTCMFPLDGITKLWGMGIIIGFFIAICIYSYFYFFSLPTRHALKRYWLLSLLVLILCSVVLSSIVLVNKLEITDQLCVQNMTTSANAVNINIVLASFITAFEINFISAVIFILMGMIPYKSRMRAMRNYPFSI